MGCGSACGVLTEIAWMLLAKEGQDMHQKYTIDTWESVRYILETGIHGGLCWVYQL